LSNKKSKKKKKEKKQEGKKTATNKYEFGSKIK
jgi:hypothetical protein